MAVAAAPTIPERIARAPFHIMTKPVGSLCNLACSYCFYLEKAHLYPDTRNFRMQSDVLESYVRDYIAAQPGPVVSFAWQGGEPTLLGVDWFRNVVALQQRYTAGKTIENAFQTNGVLLDDEWGEFLAEHHFLVGISIDGPRHLHDAYRVDRGHQPTFDRVMAGIQVVRKHCVEFNTLTAVHRTNSQHPLEVYHFLREIGSGFIQFIPIVERAAPGASASPGLWLAPPPDHPDAAQVEAPVTPWSVRPADYGKFLCRVFDEWVRQDVGRIFVQQFDAALANWMGEPAGVCVFSRNCGRSLAMEHNGDVYCCDHYVYPEYRLGNLLGTPLAAMADSAEQRRFGEAKSATLPRYCRECPVLFACHGECPKHRFLGAPDGEPGLNYLCAGYRRFFTHISSPMRTMGALLRSEQAPAAIMRTPRSHWLPSQFPSPRAR
jgi:uncharacterized protein